MKKTDPASEKCSNSRMDFAQSWQAFRSNYKAFLFTEIFAGIAFILMAMAVWGTFSLIYFLSPNLDILTLYASVSEGFRISSLFRSLTIILALWVFFGFLNCQFGLAYDIMSSGDMFAEFKNSFSYFKKFWWQYPLLTFLLLLPHPIFSIITYRGASPPPPIDPMNSINIPLALLQLARFFIIVVLFTEIFPSLTSHGNFKDSFIENNRIIRQNWRRLLTTWGLFALIFLTPGFVLGILSIYLNPSWGLFIFGLIYFLLFSIFGFPMFSLISTGMYNNVSFTRIHPKSSESPESPESPESKK